MSKTKVQIASEKFSKETDWRYSPPIRAIEKKLRQIEIAKYPSFDDMKKTNDYSLLAQYHVEGDIYIWRDGKLIYLGEYNWFEGKFHKVMSLSLIHISEPTRPY